MNQFPRTVVVIGASRGIGAAVTQHFVDQGHAVWSVSRTAAVAGTWIQADISTPEGIAAIAHALGNQPLDALLFMGGVWEAGAFTDAYDFLSSSDAETRFVLSVNTIAPIEITRSLASNLSHAANSRAIYIGALSGLDNCPSVEVANTASEFGLRGAVQALRLALGSQNIGFTVINSGNVATEEVMLDIAAGRFGPQTPIPMAAITSAIDWLLSLPASVDVQELNLQQRSYNL
ncbi:SDR family oxidoreductase [Nodosilinea sp. LEGE 07088]|uniref:SDR family oxidoreductase n=1 Tax=Nodosilinea sp. LEGE 07088 TaxID=2777968 RepID=UPI00187E07D2|nr:SDR family oxidoreductase [Nodosilinea sp. LEGE 07088]MBE9136527.1 SDR family oxidoreductase [Nodosilinea sp. LEGE 07088]